MTFPMIPRFNFKYSIRDFFNDLMYDFKKIKPDQTPLEQYFEGNQLFFTYKARIGLFLALQSLKLKSGSYIGVQPFTCSSVLFAIKKAGFYPLFIDLDDNLRLSHEDLRLKVDQIDALIVTHTFGFPEDVKAIKQLVNNIPIIEDCAQAFLSEINGSPTGIYGDVGIFSTGLNKFLGTGSGGFIVSKNSQISSFVEHAKVRFYNPHYLIWVIICVKNLLMGISYKPVIYNLVTFPIKRWLKLTSIRVQKYPQVEKSLPDSAVNLFTGRFPDSLKLANKQRENGRLLHSLISDRFQTIIPPEGSNPNFFLLPLFSENRDLIINHLAKKGIEAGKHFSEAVHWVRSFGYVKGSCPNFERIAREIITLPCHYYLSRERICHIADSINQFSKQKKNILVDIGHPAHVHLFIHLIREMERKEHRVYVIIKNVDVIKQLLTSYNIPYTIIGSKPDSLQLKYLFQLQVILRTILFVLKHKIDSGIGVSMTLPIVSKFTGITTFGLDDDDIAVTPVAARFVNQSDLIITPDCLAFETRGKHHIVYPGFHELAYLHPHRFTPDPEIIHNIGVKVGEPFFVLRFNSFKAHHDASARGLSLKDKRKLIELLSKYGKVFITTEKQIEPEFEPYRLPVSPENIHSLLYYATMFVGDSQTMTSEAALIGTPAFKCNTFAGRLSIPNEIENKYHLCFSYLPEDFDKMLKDIQDHLDNQDLKNVFAERRERMLHEKIDLTAFLVWLVNEYPSSVKMVHKINYLEKFGLSESGT